MDFTANKPIYRQIIDFCFAKILSEEWLPDQRIPSVRELSAQLMVNSHTVLKAFDDLQNAEIIMPRRGLGFFLVKDARQKVNDARRDEFFTTTMPEIFQNMRLLGITIEELTTHYKHYLSNQEKSK